MDLRIELEQENDGRSIAEVPQLPGVLAYGATADAAATKAEILALRVMAERLERGEPKRGRDQHLARSSLSDWSSPKHAA
jgi:predicted RNase H-like HicB family nuclease